MRAAAVPPRPARLEGLRRVVVPLPLGAACAAALLCSEGRVAVGAGRRPTRPGKAVGTAGAGAGGRRRLWTRAGPYSRISSATVPAAGPSLAPAGGGRSGGLPRLAPSS